MLLTILAEAVNAVSDWPNFRAMCSDDPLSLTLGLVVGPHRWDCTIREVRSQMPALVAKQNELRVMVARHPLPLRPHPHDRRAREIHIRYALLTAAAEITDSDMRRETAKWVTVLGRLRASTV